MVDSVPIALNNNEYFLRFEQDDVINCESELKMGYVNFFRVEENRPITLSLLLCRVLLHRGLRTKNKKGELEYEFIQTADGAKDAGALIQAHTQSGGSLIGIWEKCFESFAQGWFGKPKDKKTDEDPSKN